MRLPSPKSSVALQVARAGISFACHMPSVRITVPRGGPEAGRSNPETYTIPLAEKASVLDALMALQRGPCPDLAFRYSCRVGMCGSCALVVNGSEKLACSTTVASLGSSHLRLEPLRNLPVVKDLAVDLKPFFAAYCRVMPQFVPRGDLSGFYPLPHDGKEWQGLNRQPQCIDCGACFSSCTLVTLHPRYAGPMALNRALSLVTDPRDNARRERLTLVTGEDGAFRCHTLANCRQVCPRGISPTASIERLKRLAVLQWLGGWFGGRRQETKLARAK